MIIEIEEHEGLTIDFTFSHLGHRRRFTKTCKNQAEYNKEIIELPPRLQKWLEERHPTPREEQKG